MGNNLLDAAVRVQSNTGGSGTSAQWQYGIDFDGNNKNPVTASLLHSDSACSPTRGIHFESTAFTSHAIHVDNMTGTYGMQVTGSPTIGYEHDGSSATAAFRAHGGGTSAFKVDSSASYTNGLDFQSCTFSGGYEIVTDSFAVQNSGLLEFRNLSSSGSAGSLVGYVTIAINGTQRKIPYYATR